MKLKNLEQIPAGKFNSTPIGARVFHHTVEISTSANVNQYILGEKNVLDRKYIIGIWVLPPSSDYRASSGSDSINANAFNSANLTLMDEETEVAYKIPFAHILLANNNGHAFEVNTGRINLSRSRIQIGDTGAAADDEVISLTFEYLKEHKTY